MRLFLMNLLGLEALLRQRLRVQEDEHRKAMTALMQQHAATIMRIEDGKESFRVEVRRGRGGRFRAFVWDANDELMMSSAPHGFETEGEGQEIVSRMFNGRRLLGPQSVAP